MFARLLGVISLSGFLAATSPPGAGSTLRPPDARMVAAERLFAASRRPPQIRFAGGYPRSFIGSVPAAGRTPVGRARQFLADYASLYGLDNAAIRLDVRRQARLAGVVDSITFTETYRGIPVEGADLVVNLVRGDVISTLGGLLHADPGELRLGLGPRDAEAIAFGPVGALGARPIGRTTLFLRDPSLWLDGIPRPRPVWRVVIGHRVAAVVSVDARTGEVLAREPYLKSDALDGLDLDLEDAENDASMEADSCFWASDETGVGDEDGINPAYIND